MLEPGDIAPDFTLPDHTGRPVSLREVLAKGPAVLFFYPRDDSRVCTAEACMFRDKYAQLASAGVQVMGISPQGAAAHTRFVRRHNLSYPLLVDTGRKTAKAYGAVGLMGLPIPLGIRRVTYLIGTDGVILDCASGELGVQRHEELVQRALARSVV
jgi:thioredoxin-dependent peroxiredoxin